MDKDEPKQLKLTNRTEGEAGKEKKEKKEKEPKGNIWVVIIVILITVAASLIFYFTGPVEPQIGGKEWTQQEDSPGGSKVYQF